MKQSRYKHPHTHNSHMETVEIDVILNEIFQICNLNVVNNSINILIHANTHYFKHLKTKHFGSVTHFIFATLTHSNVNPLTMRFSQMCFFIHNSQRFRVFFPHQQGYHFFRYEVNRCRFYIPSIK